MARKSSRDAILAAAERVIKRQGISSTTIEAVAAEAGVSKGGLFYHFASKKELMLQLLDRYREQFEALRAEILETLPDTPGRLLKATLLACIRHPAKSTPSVGNIIALLDDVSLREKIAQMQDRVFRESSANSTQPELVALALLSADGLWLANIFGRKFPEGFREKVIARLLTLVDTLTESAVEGDADDAERSDHDRVS